MIVAPNHCIAAHTHKMRSSRRSALVLLLGLCPCCDAAAPLSSSAALVDEGGMGRGHIIVFLLILVATCALCFRFKLWTYANKLIDRFFSASDRVAPSVVGGSSLVGSSWQDLADANFAYGRTVHLARSALVAIVLVPLVLTPFGGFMLASGLDALLLAAYTLLALAGILCSILETAARRMHEAPRQGPVNAFDGRYRGPPPATPLRIAYVLAWVVVPLLTRNLDWSAYSTLPTGVVGMLVISRLRSCWCADYYAMGMLCAPTFAIALGYSLDLANSPVVSGLSVTDWRAHHQANKGSVDAYIFRDGFVVGEWAARRAGWTHETGGGEVKEYMRSEYGVAPVVANRSCVVGLDNVKAGDEEDTAAQSRPQFTDVSGSELRVVTAVKHLDEAAPALQLSRCEVSLIVMFSKRWAPSSGAPTSDVAVERDLPLADPSRYHGCNHGGIRGALCVYADPLYRAPRGTPTAALEECRLLLAAHGLGPISICDEQFYLIGDYSNNPRQRYVLHLAIGTGLLVVALATVGIARPDWATLLRKHGAPCDRAWRYISNVDELLL